MVNSAIFAVFVTQTLNAVTAMAVLPLLPFYAMKLGASALDLALLGTVYNFSSMVCCPIAGFLSDRAGRKKIMLAGLLGQALCNAYQSRSTSIASLMLVRLFLGIACSSQPVEMAYLMDQTSGEDDLRNALLVQRIIVTIGAMVGPLLAQLFVNYGFHSLCWGMVLSNLVGFLIGGIFWVEDEYPRGLPSRDSSLSISHFTRVSGDSLSPTSPSKALYDRSSRWYRLLTGRITGSLLFISFVASVGGGIADGPEVMFTRDHFGYGEDEVAFLLLACNVATLLFTPLLTPCTQLFGETKACIAGQTGIACLNVWLVFCTGVKWVPWVYASLITGVFGSLCSFSYLALLSRVCPSDRMGTMLGLQSFIEGLAGTVAPAIGGFIYTKDNFLPYGMFAGLSAASALLLIGMLPLIDKVKAAHDEEEKAMSSHDPYGSELEASSPSHVSEPIFYGKNYAAKVLTNELRMTLDPDLKHLFYDTSQSRATRPSSQMLRRASTIGQENLVRSKTVIEDDDCEQQGVGRQSSSNARERAFFRRASTMLEQSTSVDSPVHRQDNL